MSEKKIYDVAKFCAQCNETIWSEVYFQCTTCTALKYYLCDNCEAQGKFRLFHSKTHKLVQFPEKPVVISAPRHIERVFANCAELEKRGLGGDR